MNMIIIKNNLKLMLRNKWIIMMMTVLPLIVIAALSSAFSGLLSTDKEVSPFKLGISIDNSYLNDEGKKQLESVCNANDITVINYDKEDGDSIINSNEVVCYIEIKDNNMKVYKNSDYTMESSIAENIVSGFLSGNYEKADGSINEERLDNPKIASSTDYYVIIEIVYFAWCGMISLAAVISSERKNKIERRYKTSPVSAVNIYLGKLIPCILANVIELTVAIIASAILFNNHWGNIEGSISIGFLLICAVSAFGIIVFYLFKKIAVSVVAAWMIIFSFGFVGGTFNTYMYSIVPHSMELLSPIYHVNRVLVEYSTMGSSNYTLSAILYLLGILIVCFVGGVILINKKMEVQ